MKRALLVIAAGVLLVVGFGAPAEAQYVPPGCSGTTFLGNSAPGGTITGTIGPSCKFTGPVSITVNGASGGPAKTPNANGGVNVVIQIQSTSTALVNDPTQVPLAPTGSTNFVNATGLTASGTVTVTGTFTVSSTAATAAPAAAPTAPSSTVAFTGANILRWSLAALALIGIGVLFVMGSRRRRLSD